MKILVTGCAGFIGFHLCKELMNKKKVHVIGIDNLNAYYSIRLKNLRLGQLRKYKRFKFIKNDISDFNNLKKIFKKNKFDIIFNLAAQAGVRYSIKNPTTYILNNPYAYLNLLEYFKNSKKLRLILYASSSSVFGDGLDKKI